MSRVEFLFVFFLTNACQSGSPEEVKPNVPPPARAKAPKVTSAEEKRPDKEILAYIDFCKTARGPNAKATTPRVQARREEEEMAALNLSDATLEKYDVMAAALAEELLPQKISNATALVDALTKLRESLPKERRSKLPMFQVAKSEEVEQRFREKMQAQFSEADITAAIQHRNELVALYANSLDFETKP